MTTTVSISLTATDVLADGNLPPGVHSMDELVPILVARYGLPPNGNSEPSIMPNSGRLDLFDLLVAGLEVGLSS